ncbi:MAG: hypothetical protein L0Y71_22160 [Gemmataceae bacterium]|nr:hypothetical protein [Gemmataceae bacterium]
MTKRQYFAVVAWIGALALLFGFAVGAQDVPPKKGKSGPKNEAPPLKKWPFKKKQDDSKTEVLSEAGELLKSDPLDPVRGRRTHFKAYDVKMAPGKTYVIRLFDQNGNANMDPYLRLEDSAGRNLAQDDDGEGNLNSRIEHNPGREETYKIIATTLSGGRTGKFLLTVDAYPPGKAPPSGRHAGFGSTMNTAMSPGPAQPMQYGDVEIRCMTWGQAVNPGNNVDTHGYIEYRFFIDNRSPDDHRITLTLPRSGGNFNGVYVSSLRRTVDVKAGSSVQVSLFQPDLPIAYIGRGAKVEIDGRLAPREAPINTPANRGARSTSRMFWGGGPASAPATSFLTPASMYADVAATQNQLARASRTQLLMQQGPEKLESWSNHWLGYTSFDGVMVHGGKLQEAPDDVRTALWQYVECGGTLLVTGPAKFPESWDRARVEFAGLTAFFPGFGQCLVEADADTLRQWAPEQWQLAHEMWTTSRAAWHQVTSPNDANGTLPVVDDVSIPVRGLFVAMVLFVIVIGPVNVYWLGRAKRRLWLLWTVPGFALLACLALIGYMVVTEGWHGHVRSQTITILDEHAQRAATIGWIGYYCPTTPAGGLRFSDDTELTPHLDFRHLRSGSRTAQPCSIDWTSQQHLTDGWVTAKVPLHFMLRRNEARLERLTARANPDGTRSITNGLGVPIQQLWVATQDGTILGASDIGPGASVTLAAADLPEAGGDLGTACDLFSRNWVQQADEMTKKPADYLRPGTYIAVIDDAPFIDQGLRRAQSRRALSIVFGVMKEPL